MSVCWAVAVDVFFCAHSIRLVISKPDRKKLVISTIESIHLTDWKNADAALIKQRAGEERNKHGLGPERSLSRLFHSLRKKEKIESGVQPLQRILIPVLSAKLQAQIQHVGKKLPQIGGKYQKPSNISMICFRDFWWKSVKPNLSAFLGKKLGPKGCDLWFRRRINSWGQDQIAGNRDVKREKINCWSRGWGFELPVGKVTDFFQDIPAGQ